MWIVLLDQSGSMGQPFSSSTTAPDRRTRQSQHEIKLDAAKESILIELGRNPDMPVALFGFTTKATLAYQGIAGDVSGISDRLDQIPAGGGTDISAALGRVSKS